MSLAIDKTLNDDSARRGRSMSTTQFVSLSGLSQDHHATLLEWAALWAAMDEKPSEWIPTTEAMYWEMLGAVPPRKMVGRNFLVGEASHSNGKGEAVYSCFTKFGDTYKAKNLTLAEFMAEHGYIPKKELR